MLIAMFRGEILKKKGGGEDEKAALNAATSIATSVGFHGKGAQEGHRTPPNPLGVRF